MNLESDPRALSVSGDRSAGGNGTSRLYEALARLDARVGNYSESRTFETRRTELWRKSESKLPDNPYIRRELEKPLLNLSPNSANQNESEGGSDWG